MAGLIASWLASYNCIARYTGKGDKQESAKVCYSAVHLQKFHDNRLIGTIEIHSYNKPRKMKGKFTDFEC